MSSLEERLRAASRETAQEVTADSVPPLRLPPDGARYNGASNARSRIHRWLAPAAAAAAVLVIAVGTTVVAALGHSTLQPRRGPAALPGHVPPYYVALELVQPHAQEGPTRAVVASTLTGAVLATVSVPRPYATFAGVVAAADDRTFVLEAQLPYRQLSAHQAETGTRFFKLTISPNAPARNERAHLTHLPVPAEPLGALVRFALSPDGSKLAVTVASLGKWTRVNVGPPHLSVFDLRTGAARTWPTPFALGQSLTWLADNRTLALAGTPTFAFSWQVRLLDTTAPGSSFAADARVAVRIGSTSRLIWREVLITPDGRTLLVARETRGTARLQKYDVRTGRLASTVDTRKVGLGEFDELQWSGQSGRVLITLLPRHPEQTGPGVNTERTAAIIVGRRLYPIPWSRTAIEGAW